MRCAVYFAPDPETLLYRAGSAFLGRDAVSGKVLRQPVPPGILPERFSAITADARRYGFHATLKAPFPLREGVDIAALRQRTADLAAGCDRFLLPLTPALISGFVALVPAEPSLLLDQLAARLVVELDDLRAPLSEADLARRRRSRLDRVEDDYLVRYGYPYVLDRFKFHMTLSSRLEAPEAEIVLDLARQCFQPLLETPVEVDRVALYVEPSPGSDFIVDSFYPLKGASDKHAV